MPNKKLNEKLEVEVYFLNGYVSNHLKSYEAAAGIYNMNVVFRDDYSLKQKVTTSNAEELLKQLKGSLPKTHRFAIIVTNVPLTNPDGTRTFGIIDPKEKIALFSEDKLVSEERNASERVMKEVAHLIGHFWGLGHCANSTCIMSYSKSLQDVDAKLPMLCPSCKAEFEKAYKQLIS